MQKNREGKKETVTKEVMPINLKLSAEYFPHDHLSFQWTKTSTMQFPIARLSSGTVYWEDFSTETGYCTSSDV